MQKITYDYYQFDQAISHDKNIYSAIVADYVTEADIPGNAVAGKTTTITNELGYLYDEHLQYYGDLYGGDVVPYAPSASFIYALDLNDSGYSFKIYADVPEFPDINDYVDDSYGYFSQANAAFSNYMSAVSAWYLEIGVLPVTRVTLEKELVGPVATITAAEPITIFDLLPIAYDGSAEGVFEFDTEVIGTEKGDSLKTDVGDDILDGRAGDDILDGGVGADEMSGGKGDDTYHVDNSADVVVELADEGTDTVISSITRTLSDNVENLTLTGTLNIIGTGNSLDNVITGNDGDNQLDGLDGNDILDGGAGADQMNGGFGDDTYYVDDSQDVVIEDWDLLGGTDTVFSTVTFTLGANVEKLELIGNANIDGTGNSGANTIKGNDGDNVLDGRGGADQMFGGAGNDTYGVDNAGDKIVENAGEGIDTVYSSVTYWLWTQSQHIENLVLTGTVNIDGTGNGLANTITGNSGSNVLNGGAGADNMRGGAGNDTYVVDHAGDTITEVADDGTDTVLSSVSYALYTQGQHIENLTLTGTGNINAIGNTLGNILTGNSGLNVLVGGAGDDTYVVQNTGDTVVEYANQGSDTVLSSVSYALYLQSQQIENLTLTGAANISGVGNALANTLVGNDGNNALNGGAGADTMSGGAGDDTYVVDNAGDTIVEIANEGSDTVLSSVSYQLWQQSQHIENLTLTGTANIGVVGNALGNTLVGNAGNNTLNGGAGADTMSGGAGDDTYVVDNAGDTIVENANEGTDTVQSSVTYALYLQGQHIENLTLTGTGNINAIGNTLGNILTGNSGLNVLVGGAGDDTYVVQNTGDTVVENANQGSDTVLSSVSYALYLQSQHIENLTLTGAATISGVGNALDNTITGNAGNNVLNGGAGADIIIGGLGADQLAGGSDSDIHRYLSLTDSTVAVAGRDTITEFVRGADLIDLSELDAKTSPGNAGDDAFTCIGSSAFTGAAGELNFINNVISGDVNGDSVADFAINLTPGIVAGLDAGDFIL